VSTTSSRPRSAAALGAAFVALLALLTLLVGIARPAAAQDQPSAPAAKREWALTPTGPDPSQPGQRTTFSFTGGPGTTLTDSVTVFNYSAGPLTFKLYGGDASNTPDGPLALTNAGDPVVDVGLWLALQTTSVTLEPNEASTIPIGVVIPADATPGDHTGGVIASISSQSTDADGNAVTVESRVGVPVYVRVDGPLDPSLTIEDLSVAYPGQWNPLAKDTAIVSYTVKNVGNVRLAAHQDVTVDGPLGWELANPAVDDLPALLPGASVTRTVEMAGIPPALRLTATVRLSPFESNDDARTHDDVTRSTNAMAVPWLLVVVLVVALVVLLRLRRRRGAGGAQPDLGPPPPMRPVLTGVAAPGPPPGSAG
jgi:hypothetical protein